MKQTTKTNRVSAVKKLYVYTQKATAKKVAASNETIATTISYASSCCP